MLLYLFYLIDDDGSAMLPGQEKDSGTPDIFMAYAWVHIYKSYGEISARAYIGKLRALRSRWTGRSND